MSLMTSLNKWGVAAVLLLAAVVVYQPRPDAQFVLDDHYTIVKNPLIKDRARYAGIWTHRLFDAHPSAGYIKLPYYRPVLQSSFILDYSLFGLDARGYQWINLFIHCVNAFLIFLLVFKLFGKEGLALGSAALFLFLPAQEWVVRYITGRGDSLQVLIGLLFLLAVLHKRYWQAAIFLIASLLTRESAVLLPFYVFLMLRARDERAFGWGWILIGLVSMAVNWHMVEKQGNVLILHFFYFTWIGLCVLLARLNVRVVWALVTVFAVLSFGQGRYWTSEENLLRHTRQREWWDWTVSRQQLVMKYDADEPAVRHLISTADNDIVKSMWVRRLGVIYFDRGDHAHAREFFQEALKLHPKNTDASSALEVVNALLRQHVGIEHPPDTR